MGLEFWKNYIILRTGYHETPPYFSFDFITVRRDDRINRCKKHKERNSSLNKNPIIFLIIFNISIENFNFAFKSFKDSSWQILNGSISHGIHVLFILHANMYCPKVMPKTSFKTCSCIYTNKYYSLHAIRNPTLPTIGMLRHVLCRKPKTIRVAISLQRKW